MRRLTLFVFEYNIWGGFVFEILGFETKNFNRKALFSITFSRGWLIFGMMYFNFKKYCLLKNNS